MPVISEHATAAEVELDDLVRPGREPEELLHGRQLAVDDGGRRSVGELRVSFHMVEMAVGVSDDQFVALARMLGKPCVDDFVHGLAQGVLVVGLLARPGVEEHRPLAAEQQVQERRLGGEGLALPQHVRVRVVRGAPGTAGLCRASDAASRESSERRGRRVPERPRRS